MADTKRANAQSAECPSYYSSRVVSVPVQIHFNSEVHLKPAYFRFVKPNLIDGADVYTPLSFEIKDGTLHSLFCLHTETLRKPVFLALGPRRLDLLHLEDLASSAHADISHDADASPQRSTPDTTKITPIQLNAAFTPDWIALTDYSFTGYRESISVTLKFFSPGNKAIRGTPMRIVLEEQPHGCRGLGWPDGQWHDVEADVIINREVTKSYPAL